MPVNKSNLNTRAESSNSYDAIVIGSGMSGGWAAKELCEKGLKTLVLERGRDVKHIEDYPTATKHIWEFPYRNNLPPDVIGENPIVSRCYAFREATEHFFVKDHEHPYVQKNPFDWIRGYQVGGRSLLWARMVQRWSEFDFEANLNDGHGIDWPIRYGDLAPWYSHVEKFAGISGNRDGLPQIPDGEFLPPMEMNCVEKHFKEQVEAKMANRDVVISRTANLSRPHNGRRCLYRSLCERGCPFGGYFSANSTTLPAAADTGNMTLRPHSVVHSIIYDEEKGKAAGVRVIDAYTKEIMEFYSDIIFVNAGSLNSLLILMNSTSGRFPEGLGNDSGVLGRYMLFHNYRGGVSAQMDGYRDRHYSGYRPTGCYIPRFRNFGSDRQRDFLRGYSLSFGANRATGNLEAAEQPLGADFKEKLVEPGGWNAWLGGMGEVLPHRDNKVSLSRDKTDEWGIPQLEIDITYSENDEKMVEDMLTASAEMFETAGFKNIRVNDTEQAPGLDIHEMGGARMGKDPEESILNGMNQMHAVPNVFVSDGACMTSSACQNPSLTYMAITARAVHYAVEELKKGNI